eukprot:TRINITY_DN11930_c0_g1_i1.p1 TRINITY_DN11930_c0_g1~~TRINITY_DN11930_c0_g1_i1.p1  ORF type:complete len:250 (+),score=52.66 TRINITY_DN11930_c0_g1_i1:73-750(+)
MCIRDRVNNVSEEKYRYRTVDHELLELKFRQFSEKNLAKSLQIEYEKKLKTLNDTWKEKVANLKEKFTVTTDNHKKELIDSNECMTRELEFEKAENEKLLMELDLVKTQLRVPQKQEARGEVITEGVKRVSHTGILDVINAKLIAAQDSNVAKERISKLEHGLRKRREVGKRAKDLLQDLVEELRSKKGASTNLNVLCQASGILLDEIRGRFRRPIFEHCEEQDY